VNLSAVQMRDHAPMGIFSPISTRRSGRSRCAASGSCPSPISIFADVTKVCEVAHMRLVPARLYSTPFIRRSEMVQSSNATRLMRIQARPGSLVEARHYRYPQRGWVQPDAIARGIP